jgi:putative endonuclease
MPWQILMSKWFVYIIETLSNRFYTGITNNIERRFSQHASGKGAKFFRIDKPKEIIHIEIYENKSQALKRELEIKKMTKKEKLKLISHSSKGH